MTHSANFLKGTDQSLNYLKARSFVEDMDYPVFPLDPRTKRPRTKNGFRDASKDLQKVGQWWPSGSDSMIGVPTGQVSGIVVVDIDNKNGKCGSESLAVLEAQYGELPKTYAIRTPTGGYHYVFKLREGQRLSKSINKLGEGIDFLAEGAYAVAPESINAEGKKYEILCADSIPYLPDWFEALVATPIKKSKKEADKQEQNLFVDGKIPEGQRNQSLFLLLSTLRAKGLEGEKLYIMAYLLNTHVCHPPMSNEEVANIVNSADSLDAAYSQDLIGYAERFADRFCNEVQCVDGGQWYHWNGKVWKESPIAANEAAKLLAKEVYALAKEKLGSPSLDNESHVIYEDLFAHAKKMLNTPLHVLSVAASDPKLARRYEEFDGNSYVINAANGIVDLNTGALLPHDSKQLMTRILEVNYRPEAQSSAWNDFMAFYTDGNPEIEAYLARMFGGIGLIDGNPDEVMMILSGPAANGKSTFSGAIAHVLGSYTDILRSEVLMGDSKFSDFRNDIADLRGARLVITNEPPQNCTLNCAFVKGYTGGDQLKGRHNYSSAIKFKASGLPVLVTNWEPELPHGDVAMHRRLQLYRHNSAVAEGKRDLGLKDMLKQPEHAEAILAWLLRGRLDYLKQGLNPPQLIRNDIQDYIVKKDLFSAFLREHCIESLEVKTQADKLWNTYHGFHISMETTLPSKRKFYELLGRKYEKRKIKGISYYLGIGLNA